MRPLQNGIPVKNLPAVLRRRAPAPEPAVQNPPQNDFPEITGSDSDSCPDDTDNTETADYSSERRKDFRKDALRLPQTPAPDCPLCRKSSSVAEPEADFRRKGYSADSDLSAAAPFLLYFRTVPELMESVRKV